MLKVHTWQMKLCISTCFLKTHARLLKYTVCYAEGNKSYCRTRQQELVGGGGVENKTELSERDSGVEFDTYL